MGLHLYRCTHGAVRQSRAIVKIGRARARTATLVLLFAFAAAPRPAQARPNWSSYAIVLGYNEPDPESSRNPLAFADDDAVRNALLWRELDAHVTLLTRLDSDTKQDFPNVEINGPPTLPALRRAIRAVNARILESQNAGRFTVFYFVYSGHGGLHGHDGYITLEGRRLTQDAFANEVAAQLLAHRIHVIIDACDASAMARGPDDQTETVAFTRPFVRARTTARLATTGFLLPSVSLAPAFEWDRYRAGVFSHLLRSALRGAADVDGDSRLSYTEVAAFLTTAYRNLPQKVRHTPITRPPTGDDTLAYIPTETARTLVVDRDFDDHLYLADENTGRRYVDMRPGDRVFRLMLPPHAKSLALFNVDRQYRYDLPEQPHVKLSALSAHRVVSEIRGPRRELQKLFAVPFDLGDMAATAPPTDAASRESLRRHADTLRTTALGLAAVAGVVAAWASVKVYRFRDKQQNARNPSSPGNYYFHQSVKGFAAAGGVALSAVLTAAASGVLYYFGDHDHSEP